MGSKRPTPNPGKGVLCGLPRQCPAAASGAATAPMAPGRKPTRGAGTGRRPWATKGPLTTSLARLHTTFLEASIVPHLQSTPGDTQSQLAPARSRAQWWQPRGKSPRSQTEPGGLPSPPSAPHGLGTPTPAHLPGRKGSTSPSASETWEVILPTCQVSKRRTGGGLPTGAAGGCGCPLSPPPQPSALTSHRRLRASLPAC